MSEHEIEEFVEALNMKKFRADQIFRAINNKNVRNINEIKQLPRSERDILSSKTQIKNIQIFKTLKSKLDTTKKLLYKLDDGYLIEGVLMDYKHGYTLCISTQVGCRMGCDFCASTKEGLIRNLEPFEITSQVYEVEEEFDIKISNIVLMGSGEPFDNYQNVIKALNILNHKKGRNLGMRNITISTCGIAPKIRQLAYDLPQVGLAVSLHFLDQRKREINMPIAKAYSLDELIQSIKFYQKVTNNRISFEYTVIPGLNDSINDGKLLKTKLSGLNYIVNLIALNPIEDYNKDENYENSARKFKKILDNLGVNNTLRRELGSDISASCGQLKQQYLKEGEK